MNGKSFKTLMIDDAGPVVSVSGDRQGTSGSSAANGSRKKSVYAQRRYLKGSKGLYNQWVENNQSNFRIYLTDICISRLMVLC